MAITLDGDIRDIGDFYQLAGGPRIAKRGGMGRALAYLLDHLGQDVRLEEIVEKAGWLGSSEQSRKLYLFEMTLAVNAWSKVYRMIKTGRAPNACYRVEKIANKTK